MSNFSLAFWSKRWHQIDILKLTDLYHHCCNYLSKKALLFTDCLMEIFNHPKLFTMHLCILLVCYFVIGWNSIRTTGKYIADKDSYYHTKILIFSFTRCLIQKWSKSRPFLKSNFRSIVRHVFATLPRLLTPLARI